MSRWKWQPSSGNAQLGTLRHYTIRDTLDEAYDDAERIYASMSEPRRVAILLGTDTSVGVADTMEPERFGGEWVVGRERWRENEARAVAEGRA